MPNNLITDQEIAFVHLGLSGTMTDRQAAEAVGLNPDTAAHTKSKPRVRDYMLKHRAAVLQQLAEQDTEKPLRVNVARDRVLARLWDIADLDPERTRNGMSAQVKALSMIIAIEGLIPDRNTDRRAVSAQNQPAPQPVDPPFYVAAWKRAQNEAESVDPQHAQAQEEAAGRADDSLCPIPDPTPDQSESLTPATELSSSRPVVEGPERSVVEGPAVPAPLDASQATSSPQPPRSSWVPDSRVPFSIWMEKNRFGPRR
jgi:hypothetical protein